MLRLKAIVVALLSLTTAGCVDEMARDENKLQITAASNDTGAVFIWPPYASAAVVDKENNRCVLAASGAKTFSASSEAAFKAALEKIQGEASLKQQLAETFNKISAGDKHSAFLDVALFQLCILDQNGTFKPKNGKADAMMKAYLATVEAASTELK